MLLLCALLSGLTLAQQRVWRSNLTLWSAVVHTSPRLARPAINLAVAYRQTGHPAQAVSWLEIAGPLTWGDPRGAEYRFVIAREFSVLESFGTFACESPTAKPYC